ncbi:hypothetical protein TSUD_210670 [Trifolium subterraneum]|uniref:Aminotransferase-like plant mobile domain-containing protein n=1 Tax=Trifolium subterraneum TaxID=3900 RepID=A0A2Z6N525_TRISU|nr:hypothetical protein TSUD_210670 [Trifolium subterraneum]
MKDIISSDMHINNIKKWTLDDDVKRKVEDMGFQLLVKLHEELHKLQGSSNLPLDFLSALMRKYDVQADCFRFQNGVDLDFGLEDIFYITGLPINGMPVSGIIPEDVVQILENHLALENTVAKDMLIIE